MRFPDIASVTVNVSQELECFNGLKFTFISTNKNKLLYGFVLYIEFSLFLFKVYFRTRVYYKIIYHMIQQNI